MMPYLIMRESHVTDACLVEGLPLNEIRLVTDRSSSSSELKDEKNRRVEIKDKDKMDKAALILISVLLGDYQLLLCHRA